MKLVRTIKNVGLLLLSVGIMATITPSCKKDGNGGAGGSAAAGTIKASAGGTSFTTAQMVTMASKAMGTTINIQGNTINASGDNHGIVFTIVGVDGSGTYEINVDDKTMTTAVYTRTKQGGTSMRSWVAPFKDGPIGEIKISTIDDKHVEGTFNFTGKEQEGDKTEMEVKGSFNVNFQ